MSGTNDSQDLTGKRVLITGAASGIGAATARLAAADGATLFLADLPGPAGEELAAELGATFVATDVSDASAWESTMSRVGALDMAILNAGVEFRPTPEFNVPDDPSQWDLDRYDRAVGVNINGVAYGVRAVVPALEESGGGVIGATASVAGLLPFSLDPVYSMTKWAVVGLVRALAPPLKLKGIRINAICPGPVATPMTRVSDGSVPNGMADPADVGRAHLNLALSSSTGRAVKVMPTGEPEPHSFSRVTGTENL